MRGAQEKADQLRAIASGVPESKLLSTANQMDVGAAARSKSFLDGGKGNASTALGRATANAPAINTKLDVNRPNAQQDAAILASPAPVAAGRAANQTGGPIDYNAIAERRKAAGEIAPAQQAGNALARATTTTPAVATTGGIGKTLAADGGQYKGALDAAAGGASNLGANGYGTGSVRFAKAGEERQGPSQVTENGVIGQAPAAYDPEQARAQLAVRHPAIFKAGSPENAAFDAHVKGLIAKGLTPEQAMQDAHKNADMIVGRVVAADAATTAPNRAMADAANPVPVTSPGIEQPRDTFPQPPPSPALLAGQNAASKIVGGIKAVGSALDRSVIAPVENFTRGAGNYVRGLVGNTTPLPEYKPMAGPSVAPPAQVAGQNRAQMDAETAPPAPPVVADAKKKKNAFDNL